MYIVYYFEKYFIVFHFINKKAYIAFFFHGLFLSPLPFLNVFQITFIFIKYNTIYMKYTVKSIKYLRYGKKIRDILN